MLAAAAAALGQTPTTELKTELAKPTADVRETPRGALLGFLDTTREGDFRRVSSFLHVRREHTRTGAPEQLARELKKVLDRELSQDPARISNAP